MIMSNIANGQEMRLEMLFLHVYAFLQLLAKGFFFHE